MSLPSSRAGTSMGDADESHLIRERRAKLERLRSRGVEPYPWSFAERRPIREVLLACESLVAGAHSEGAALRVAGRLKTVREHGRSAFLDIEDLSGSLQLFARVDELGDARYKEGLADVDPGDIVGATGVPMVTKRGEPSLLVREIVVLAKAIRPPPEKFHGLKDPEARLRHRHADLLASGETRQRFVARSLLLRETRTFLDAEEFLEVETPVLVPVASGAAAEPFRTRSRYLEEELQLRIALELPLKRLLVGGLERVYEIGHTFRNEDMDSTHSPEFTMLELYWAYADYTDMRRLVERLYERLAHRVGEILPDVPRAKEAEAWFSPPFATVDYTEELERRSGLSDLASKSREELRKLAREAGATVGDDSPAGKFLDKLFEHYVEPTLERPTFVLDFPTSTTPLAKRHRERPGRVERFELFSRGIELANAYTELNDPEEQEARFREQLGGRAEDHMALDDEFLDALRYGMPPASGLGIGVDRMVMALTGTPSIKEIILFPQSRAKGNEGAAPP